MCEHCGCRGIEPISNLMDEHDDLASSSGSGSLTARRQGETLGIFPVAVVTLDVAGWELVTHVHRGGLDAAP